MKKLILFLFLFVFVIAGCSTTGEVPEDNTALQPAEDTVETEVTPPDTSDEPDEKATDPEESTEPDETPETDETETPKPDETKSDDSAMPDKKTYDNEQESPEIVEDPMDMYREYLNNESVKKVVDAFIIAIYAGNDDEYQKFIVWDKVTEYAQKDLDVVKCYYDCKDLQKAFGNFNYKSSNNEKPYEKINYYNKKIGTRPHVGYGIWKFTPKGEQGSEFTWIVRLEFNTGNKKWQVVEMADLPEEVRGYKRQNFGIDDLDNNRIMIYTYYFTPEQFVAFQKKEKEDPYYVPQSEDEYHHRNLITIVDPPVGDDDDFEPPEIDVPEKIENLKPGNEYTDKINEIENGTVGAYKKFSKADKNRDVVGTLLNIIIDGANDKFKTKLSRDAAIEANKALQMIFDKNTGRNRAIYGMVISKQTEDEGQDVDDNTLLDVVDVLQLWIKLFENEGWNLK